MSQAEFGDLGGLDADLMTVSRWERGVAIPHPDRLKKLAAIARRNECEDLVPVFDDELAGYWKSLIGREYPQIARLITLLEISVINANIDSNSPVAHETLIALEAIAQKFIRHLIKERKGDAVLLYDALQHAAWADAVAEHAPVVVRPAQKKPRKPAIHRVTKKSR
jgi:transcriptional regulator with XRE-family HTH domain